MNELAFGNQTLSLDKGADNSHLTRNNDIEEWAKDVYAFVAHRFGEENIIMRWGSYSLNCMTSSQKRSA